MKYQDCNLWSWVLLHIILTTSSHALRGSSQSKDEGKKHLIFSTDCAGGLFGANAGYQQCPSFSQDGVNGPVAYRDIDDLMAITLAINSGDEATVDLIVPTFGDASMPANYLTGTQLVHTIKGRTDIPIIPGASTASQPPFIDTWSINSDMTSIGWGATLPTAAVQKPVLPEGSLGAIDPVHLFGISCVNQGVLAMKQKLEDAVHKGHEVTMLGIGPMTDYACLLLNTEDFFIRSIDKMVLLIGQEAGVPFGTPGATGRDFNMVMDPLAASIDLSFWETIDIVLMEFELTSQTNGGDNPNAILFNDETFANATLPFFQEAKKSARLTEGPFDQYTLAYALHPEWFECDNYPVYVIQCDEEPVNSTMLSPLECTSAHTYDDSSYTLSVSAELTIDRYGDYAGNLVIGNEQGNILNYQNVPAAQALACTNFASSEAMESFRSFVYNLQ